MTNIAKAAVMTAAGKNLEIKEYPLPRVEQGCILVKVTCCTVCGSDVHSWMGRRAAPTPIILGHEIVGKIVELGAGALDFYAAALAKHYGCQRIIVWSSSKLSVPRCPQRPPNVR